jgi:hypothetical protein
VKHQVTVLFSKPVDYHPGFFCDGYSFYLHMDVLATSAIVTPARAGVTFRKAI